MIDGDWLGSQLGYLQFFTTDRNWLRGLRPGDILFHWAQTRYRRPYYQYERRYANRPRIVWSDALGRLPARLAGGWDWTNPNSISDAGLRQAIGAPAFWGQNEMLALRPAIGELTLFMSRYASRLRTNRA